MLKWLVIAALLLHADLQVAAARMAKTVLYGLIAFVIAKARDDQLWGYGSDAHDGTIPRRIFGDKPEQGPVDFVQDQSTLLRLPIPGL